MDRKQRITETWRLASRDARALQLLMAGQDVAAVLYDPTPLEFGARGYEPTRKVEIVWFRAEKWCKGWRTWYEVHCGDQHVGRIN